MSDRRQDLRSERWPTRALAYFVQHPQFYTPSICLHRPVLNALMARPVDFELSPPSRPKTRFLHRRPQRQSRHHAFLVPSNPPCRRIPRSPHTTSRVQTFLKSFHTRFPIPPLRFLVYMFLFDGPLRCQSDCGNIFLPPNFPGPRSKTTTPQSHTLVVLNSLYPSCAGYNVM